MCQLVLWVPNIDGMAADDGHNTLVSRFCSLSIPNPLFEKKLENQFARISPPFELIKITLKFVLGINKEGVHFSSFVLYSSLGRCCTSSNPFFEQDLSNEVVWVSSC